MRSSRVDILIALICTGLLSSLFGCSQAPPGQQGAGTAGGGKTGFAAIPSGDYQDINLQNPGESIDISRYAVSGRFTIFEFWSPYCPPCVQIRPLLKRLTARRTDLAVRSVDVNRPGVTHIDWRSPVASQYHLDSLPAFVIYGPDRQLKATGDEAKDIVLDCLQPKSR